MTLRDEALAAFQALLDEQSGEARSQLGAVLAPWDPAAAEPADIESRPRGVPVAEAEWVRVVFAADGLHLAVQLRGGDATVQVVEDQDGWTPVQGLDPITSLADLGAYLDGLQPEYPAWVQPSGATDAYPLIDPNTGDPYRVTHDGKVWENQVDNNVWEPGVSGWREVVS